MSDILLEKIDHIEKLISELDSKIDNFLGYEELGEDELEEVKEIRKEIKRGEFVEMDKLFGEEDNV